MTAAIQYLASGFGRTFKRGMMRLGTQNLCAGLVLAALATLPLAAQQPGRGAQPGGGPAPEGRGQAPGGRGAGAGRGRGAAPAPPRSPKEAARIDLTGTWVAYVTEDWRFRMVTPPKGDYTSMPLNAEGKRVSDTWDWKKDQKGDACKAYGAPGLMRMPTRLRFSWVNDTTMKVETDYGTQTRTLAFGKPAAGARPARTRQGSSMAEWENTALAASSLAILNVPAAPPSYALKVVTNNLLPGYLRTNGVPYSENAVLTEYFDTLKHTNGQEWLILTSVVEDPQYLIQPFVTSAHFKREPDDSRWRPTPCEVVPPTVELRPAWPSN